MTENNDEQQISYIHTTCRNCVFAQFKDKRQIGCSLNKIEDYKNAGIEVLDVFDDEGVEFCLINGRFCLFYRTKELMEKHPRSSWEDITLMTTKCPYHAIVFFEKEHTFTQLKATLKNLHSTQAIMPNMVTVLNKQYPYFIKDSEKYTKPSMILEMMKNIGFHQFSLKNVYDISLSDRGLIDLVFDTSGSLPYPFYTVFKTAFDIPADFSKELNDAILIKMMQIGFGTPIDDLNGMIVNRTAHKKHGGNSFGINLEDKILKLETNGNDFIHEAKIICPCLG